MRRASKYLAFVITYIFCCSILVYADETVMAVHEKAWTSVTDKALCDKYSKYGLYASRILAVKHPEVYLQADRLFISIVNEKEYLTLTDERSRTFDTIPMVFSLDGLNLSSYKSIDLARFYPAGSPLFSYLDRRILSPAATLRKKSGVEIIQQDKIKQIELASLLYARERQRVGLNDIYVIYCDNEDAYLWSKKGLVSLRTLKPREKIDSGNPILIFNERYVWYPLMQRDDTKRSRSLNNLVEKYKTYIQKPLLSEAEDKILQKLLLTTGLVGPEYDMAILSAARVSSFYGYRQPLTRNGLITKKWRALFPGLTSKQVQSVIQYHPAGGADDIILEQIAKRANYLSPISAYLAAAGTDKNKDLLRKVADEYKKLGFEWNCLWTLGFEQMTIDESYYSGGGTCEIHANSLSAVLDMADIYNIVIHGYLIGKFTHQIVYMPEYDKVFSNGWLVDSQGTVLHCPKAIFMISDKDTWATPIEGSYIGTMSPLQASENLELLKAKHGDDIRGIRVGLGISEISFEELIKYLKAKNKNWKPIELP